MKILVLGPSGFIGSNVSKKFRSNDHYQVYTAGISVIPGISNHYVLDANNLQPDKIIGQIKPDLVINASGSPTVSFSLKFPLEDFRLNVQNTLTILDSIRRLSPHTKYINFSSAAVYGNPSLHPIPETLELHPVSPYGFHKKTSEEICRFYYEYYKVNTISLRIFSAYGPGLQKQIFWDIYNKSKAFKKEITLDGTGDEKRDFIFIDDLVSAIECIVQNSVFNGQCINIGMGQPISIKEAALLFLKSLNANQQVVFSGKQRSCDPVYLVADIHKLRSQGFSPRFTIQEGLILYAGWLKQQSILSQNI